MLSFWPASDAQNDEKMSSGRGKNSISAPNYGRRDRSPKEDGPNTGRKGRKRLTTYSVFFALNRVIHYVLANNLILLV